MSDPRLASCRPPQFSLATPPSVDKDGYDETCDTWSLGVIMVSNQELAQSIHCGSVAYSSDDSGTGTGPIHLCSVAYSSDGSDPGTAQYTTVLLLIATMVLAGTDPKHHGFVADSSDGSGTGTAQYTTVLQLIAVMVLSGSGTK